MDLQGKTVLVVGASGALGAELTKLLVAEGARVLATATSNESAARIPSTATIRLLLDLEKPESITTLTGYLAATEKIDGIVLAAGRVGFGAAAEANPADSARLLQINFLGQVQLLQQLHATLKQSQEPFVAAITGVVAERSFPGMAAFCASKQALAGWLASVAQEWRSDNISITDARPGHTETGLADRAMFGVAPRFPQGHEPAHVARTIIDGIKNRAKVIGSTEF
jgi:cyclic-di-GMP-binding biofilm dispersal mediator protein